MKKSILAIAVFISHAAVAVEGGVNADQSVYQQYVKLIGADGECSGILIAGKYIITAGHCGSGTNVFINGVNGGNAVTVAKSVINPSYDPSTNLGSDLAVYVLSSQQVVTSTGILSSNSPTNGNLYNIFGYGSATQLKTANMGGLNNATGTTDRYTLEWIVGTIGNGVSEGGDSGGGVTDSNGNVWAAIHGGSGVCAQNNVCTYTTDVTKFSENEEFLLTNIDSLNYPTSASGSSVTIPVQNLHSQSEIVSPYADNGVTITADTCNGVTLNPLDQCAITVSGTGTLHLSATDSVQINPATSTSSNTSSSSGGGGSMNFGFIAALGLLVTLRKWFSVRRLTSSGTKTYFKP